MLERPLAGAVDDRADAVDRVVGGDFHEHRRLVLPEQLRLRRRDHERPQHADDEDEHQPGEAQHRRPVALHLPPVVFRHPGVLVERQHDVEREQQQRDREQPVELADVVLPADRRERRRVLPAEIESEALVEAAGDEEVVVEQQQREHREPGDRAEEVRGQLAVGLRGDLLPVDLVEGVGVRRHYRSSKLIRGSSSVYTRSWSRFPMVAMKVKNSVAPSTRLVSWDVIAR